MRIQPTLVILCVTGLLSALVACGGAASNNAMQQLSTNNQASAPGSGNITVAGPLKNVTWTQVAKNLEGGTGYPVNGPRILTQSNGVFYAVDSNIGGTLFVTREPNTPAWAMTGNGLVAALVVDGQNPNFLYGVNSDDDVVASRDGGKTITVAYAQKCPATDCNCISLDIAPLAIDNSRGYEVLYGAGGPTRNQLLTSTDHGVSWSATNANMPVGFVLGAAQGDVPGGLVATSTNMVTFSRDFGKSWSKPVTLGDAANLVRTVGLSHASPNLVFAGTAEGIYRSEDDGVTWRLQQATPCTAGLAIDSKTGTWYATVNDCGSEQTYYKGDSDGVVHVVASWDQGTSWSDIFPQVQNAQGGSPTATCSSSIVVDPTSHAVYASFGFCGGIFRAQQPSN